MKEKYCRLPAQVLFPYAAERLQSHLEATYDSADTQKDIQLFRQQVHSTRPATRRLTYSGINSLPKALKLLCAPPFARVCQCGLPVRHLHCACPKLSCHTVQMGDGAPAASADKAAVIAAVVMAAQADMAADRKTQALKSLQVWPALDPKESYA
jgi:hypothetical protein